MNAPSSDVTEVVVHFLKSAATNVAALGLPLFGYVPPVSFRYVENAQLKSLTVLTSQSPMSPHLVVAVAVFWTTSHEASLNCASLSRAPMHHGSFSNVT